MVILLSFMFPPSVCIPWLIILSSVFKASTTFSQTLILLHLASTCEDAMVTWTACRDQDSQPIFSNKQPLFPLQTQISPFQSSVRKPTCKPLLFKSKIILFSLCKISSTRVQKPLGFLIIIISKKVREEMIFKRPENCLSVGPYQKLDIQTLARVFLFWYGSGGHI